MDDTEEQRRFGTERSNLEVDFGHRKQVGLLAVVESERVAGVELEGDAGCAVERFGDDVTVGGRCDGVADQRGADGVLRD